MNNNVLDEEPMNVDKLNEYMRLQHAMMKVLSSGSSEEHKSSSDDISISSLNSEVIPKAEIEPLDVLYKRFKLFVNTSINDKKLTPSVLKHHGIKNNANIQPSDYISNKLNLLYSYSDGEDIGKLTGSAKQKKTKDYMSSSIDFINGQLNSFDVSLNKTYLLSFYGKVVNKLMTVPAGSMVVMLAPANRNINQTFDNIKTICDLIKDIKFLNKFLKQPGCVHDNNFCVKSASVFYPGQRYFDMELTTYANNNNVDYNHIGMLRADNISKFLAVGTNVSFKSLKEKVKLSPTTLLSEIITKTPGVHFVFACRSCSYDERLSDFVIESLYYHEFFNNFINRYSRNNCNLFQMDSTCTDLSYKVYNNIDSDKFPKFSFVSPKPESEKNKEFIDSIYASIVTMNDNDTAVKAFKSALAKVSGNIFFDSIKHINDAYNEKNKPNMVHSTSKYIRYNTFFCTDYMLMHDYIRDNLFRDNIFIGSEELIAIITDFNYPQKYVILSQFLLHLFYYYVFATNIEHIYELEDIFRKTKFITKSMIMMLDKGYGDPVKQSISDLVSKLIDFKEIYKQKKSYSFAEYIFLKKGLLHIYFKNNDTLVQDNINKYYDSHAKYFVNTFLLAKMAFDIYDTELNWTDDILRHDDTFFPLVDAIEKYIIDAGVKFTKKDSFYIYLTPDPSYTELFKFTAELLTETYDNLKNTTGKTFVELFTDYVSNINENTSLFKLYLLKLYNFISGDNKLFFRYYDQLEAISDAYFFICIY